MKKTIDIILIILCFLSVCSYFYADWIRGNKQYHFAYHTYFWGQNDAPDSSVEVDPDTNFTFVVNYYANEDNSGIEMFEIKLNYFTDYQFQDVYSLGIQILNPSNSMKFGLRKDKTDDQFFGDYHVYYSYDVKLDKKQVSYFNTDDGVSFDSTETFNSREIPYIIKIDGKPYAFDFNKMLTIEKTNQFLWRSMYDHYSSTFGYFLYRVFDSTTEITDGEGIYEYLTLELNDVFNIYEYNQITGKFDILTTYGYDVNYISFKINYHKRGAMTHEDSLFNKITGQGNGGVIWGNS